MALRPPTTLPLPCVDCKFAEVRVTGSILLLQETFRVDGACGVVANACVGTYRCGVGLRISTPLIHSPLWINLAGRGCNSYNGPSQPIATVDALGAACDGQLHTALDGQNNNNPLIARWYLSQADCIAGTNEAITSTIQVRCNNCSFG